MYGGAIINNASYAYTYFRLNSISLVNLVISLGIAVEFCSHIARGYMSSGGSVVDGLMGQKERDDRVFTTLVDIGPSVRLGRWAIQTAETIDQGHFRHHLHQVDWHVRSWIFSI